MDRVLKEDQRQGEAMPRLVTVRQAAHTLSVSMRSIWRLIGLGELPAVRVGRSVRIPRESLDAFIARGGSGR